MDQQPQQPVPPGEWPPPGPPQGPPTVLSVGQPAQPRPIAPPGGVADQAPSPPDPWAGGGAPQAPPGAPAAPTGWGVPGPAMASVPLAFAGEVAAPRRTRAGRGGLASGFTALLFIVAFGNPWVIDVALNHLRTRWIQALISANFFAHWNLRPAGSRSRGAFADAFWTDFTGGTPVQRSSLGDERWLHWVANYARIALLVFAIAVVVSIVLSGHRGNLLARWTSAWGAVFVASALVGALTGVAFYAVSDAVSFSPVHDLMLGASYGASWALLAGLPISLVGAALSKAK